MESNSTTSWKYLAPKPGSKYRQLFLKGRNIAARTIYGCFVGDESPMSPEEIADDRNIPLEAVLEAIAYCDSDPPELIRDYELEAALLNARGMNAASFDGRLGTLSPEETMAILRKFD